MNNRVNYSPVSLQDLNGIWEYIASELHNVASAESIVSGIMDAVDRVVDFPESGSKLVFDGNIDSGYRFVIYGNYMAFFHVVDGTVFVDRILYGKRDYCKIISDECGNFQSE